MYLPFLFLPHQFSFIVYCVERHLFTQFLVVHFGYYFMREVMALMEPIILSVVTCGDRWVCTIYVLLQNLVIRVVTSRLRQLKKEFIGSILDNYGSVQKPWYCMTQSLILICMALI